MRHCGWILVVLFRVRVLLNSHAESTGDGWPRTHASYDRYVRTPHPLLLSQGSYLVTWFLLMVVGSQVHAQSTRPGAATSSSNVAAPAPAAPTPAAATSTNPNTACAGGAYTPPAGKSEPWLLPLNRNGANEDDITCFFASNGVVSPLTQVNFLYGFGSSSSTISADLVSGLTPLGFEVSLGSSLSGSSSSSSSNGSSSNPGQATPQQAIQQLENGGDFYVRAIWPLLYGSQPARNLSGFIAFVPRLGINVPGMSAGTTITTDPEYNWNIAPEAYGQLLFYKQVGYLYADVRSGYQYVQPAFAQSTGLGLKNNFIVSQFAAGVQFTGFVRIGFQRYQGPAQLLPGGENDFNKFHLVIQVSPAAMVSAIKGSS
jgi:hypothetical protein